jgi:hypothetical protein
VVADFEKRIFSAFTSCGCSCPSFSELITLKVVVVGSDFG